MRISVREGAATVEYWQRIESIKIFENVYVYRVMRRIRSIKNAGRIVITFPDGCVAEQGIVGEENLIRLTRGEPLSPSPLVMIDDDGLLELSIYGFRSQRVTDKTLTSADPFDRIKSGKAKAHNIVEIDAKRLMIFEPGMRSKSFTGLALPVAMYFGYSNANLDDEHYDLDALVRFLMQQPGVLVTAQRGHVEAATPRRARSSYDAIYNIASCDQTWNRRKCISVCWIPTKQAYREVWKKAQEKDEDMYRAALDIDVLGLRQSGAAKT